MRNNKRNILTLGILSAVTCIGIASGLVFSDVFKTVAQNDDIYEINFTENKNKLPEKDTTFEVFTDKGSPYLISYNGIFSGKEAEGAWGAIGGTGAFFKFEKNTAYERNNGFNGMKTLQMNFKKEGSSFRIYFSHDGTKFDEKYSRQFVSLAGTMNIDFEGHPNYFMFKTLDDTDNCIISMKITYSCSAEEDDNWVKSHGIVPVVGSVVTYGLFPRKHISDPTLISELTARADALNVADEAYFWYNDEYYVRDTPEPKEQNYKYTDGTNVKAESGEHHFFLCEAIAWNIVSTSETSYTLDCFNIVYGRRFAAESTDYAASDLRIWFNNSFFNNSFFFEISDSYIVPTGFSEIGADEDKVWVGSKTQYETDWYQGESASSRRKEVSDFALCNYTSMSTSEETDRNGWYWTRTPYTDNKTVWYVSDSGGFGSDTVAKNFYGASPTITFKK